MTCDEILCLAASLQDSGGEIVIYARDNTHGKFAFTAASDRSEISLEGRFGVYDMWNDRVDYIASFFLIDFAGADWIITPDSPYQLA